MLFLLLFNKFSVEDFESVKTTPWEGVRNHQAKNFMKDMKREDKVSPHTRKLVSHSGRWLQVLFYHSNCKTPGKPNLYFRNFECYWCSFTFFIFRRRSIRRGLLFELVIVLLHS